MKIGLTGGIASGKSTVSDRLDSLGAKVIDADKVAHELMKPERKLWQKVVNTFGEDILQANKQIDRTKLGEMIFNDPQKKEKLDQITHPTIISEIKSRLQRLERNHKIVIADIPLLIEVGMMDFFAEVWLVYVTFEIQIKRLMQRDNIGREAAVKKIESQMSLEEKRKYADRIIDNNGSKEELEEQVQELWEEVI